MYHVSVSVKGIGLKGGIRYKVVFVVTLKLEQDVGPHVGGTHVPTDL